jgi:hypothetical protein
VGTGGAEVSVAVGGEGGEVTVKVPDERLRATAFPFRSVAVALLNERLELPGEAPGLTLNEMSATVPSEMTVWFKPKMITRIRPEEGDVQETVFPAEEAAPPMDTFCTVSRLASNERSKFNPVTPTPSSGFSRTGIIIPASPGMPEPLPTERLAPPPWACAAGEKSIIMHKNVTTESIRFLRSMGFSILCVFTATIRLKFGISPSG